MLGLRGVPPETRTDYTLISELGWRLSRTQKPDGSWLLAWRCPSCWATFKQNKVAAGEPPPSSTPSPSNRPRRT